MELKSSILQRRFSLFLIQNKLLSPFEPILTQTLKICEFLEKHIFKWRPKIPFYGGQIFLELWKSKNEVFVSKLQKNDFIPDIAPVTMDGIKRPAGTLIPNVTTVNADLTFTDFICT